MPFLAGSRLGDQREIKPVIWLSAFGAVAGVSLLENGGGSPPGIGDVWSLLSAIFFGVQVTLLIVSLERLLNPQAFGPWNRHMLKCQMLGATTQC